MKRKPGKKIITGIIEFKVVPWFDNKCSHGIRLSQICYDCREEKEPKLRAWAERKGIKFEGA